MQTTPSQTFQQWKDAQNALDDAMRHYLQSTLALQSNLYSHTHAAESISLRNSLAESWLNDSPTPDGDSVLTRAQAHLHQMRNSFLPVNSLPLELLPRIFQVAAVSFGTQHDALSNTSQGNDKDLIALTHTCSSWRRILIQTPSLWSRFELNNGDNIKTQCQKALVYLNRARGSPQSLSIRGREFSRSEFKMVLRTVTSRMEDLTQLALLDFPAPRVMGIVSEMYKLGKPGVLGTLTIQLEESMQHFGSIQRGKSGLAQSILASIHSLSLRGVRFAWDSPVYHNLIQLKIGNISYDKSPRINNMLNILAASPLLRSLEISDMWILPSDALPLKPVYLAKLEQLDLISLNDEGLELLLPMIVPQSKDLSLRITILDFEEQLASAIQTFLRRTTVTRLFLPQNLISQCLSALPDLRSLVVDMGEEPAGSFLSELSCRDGSIYRSIFQCPELHTLHLYSGSVTIGAIQQLIETRPLIQKLRFSSCYVDPFEDELSYWLQSYVEDVQFNLRLDGAVVSGWSYLMI